MILSIETSTDVCSVSLSNKTKLLSIKETKTSNSHSSVLTLLIEQLILETNLNYSSLEAIAISEGPGSYTGLRIGTSTAKGLCYALDIPLISISTLYIMTSRLLNQHKLTDKSELFIPMIDARRMEVYYAIFNNKKEEVSPTKAEVIDENSFDKLSENHHLILFGNGAEKLKNTIKSKNILIIDDIYPSAIDMVNEAYKKFRNKDFENLAYFEPFYLKAYEAKKSKVKGLNTD